MPNQLKQDSKLLPAYHFEEDTISFMDIFLILARQFKIIIITPTILCTIFIIYALSQTSTVYQSSAKIMSSSGSGSSQVTGLASQFGVSLPSQQSEPQWVYPEIIKSRTLARVMLKRKFDTEKFGPQKTLLQILTYGDGEPTVGIDTLIKSGINGVIGMINIKNNGSFYDLTISASEPLFARDFAVALIEELDAHQRKYNKAKTAAAKQFIVERIGDIEQELRTAEEALKNFHNRNRRIENSPALQLEQARLSREVSVLIGVFTTLKQQLETTKIEEVKESEFVVVLDPPEAPLAPSGTSKKLLVILAGFLGIALGVVIAFITDYAQNSDKEVQEKISQAKFYFIKNITDFIPKKLLNIFS